MMVRLYLIRHGETEWNKSVRFQGQQEIPLNETGRMQADLIGKRLAGEGIEAIYSSDLGRAWETAKIIAQNLNIHPGDLKKEASFREVNFGAWEGLTFSQRKEKDPAYLKKWMNDPVRTVCPGGESYLEHFQRVEKGLKDLLQKEAGKKVALVTHGGPIRAIVQSALGLPPLSFWNLRVDNASVSIIEFHEDKAILCLYNDTCHLKCQS